MGGAALFLPCDPKAPPAESINCHCVVEYASQETVRQFEDLKLQLKTDFGIEMQPRHVDDPKLQSYYDKVRAEYGDRHKIEEQVAVLETVQNQLRQIEPVRQDVIDKRVQELDSEIGTVLASRSLNDDMDQKLKLLEEERKRLLKSKNESLRFAEDDLQISDQEAKTNAKKDRGGVVYYDAANPANPQVLALELTVSKDQRDSIKYDHVVSSGFERSLG